MKATMWTALLYGTANDGQNWLLATAKEGNVLLFTMPLPVKKSTSLVKQALLWATLAGLTVLL
jgi:hypothetical protein